MSGLKRLGGLLMLAGLLTWPLQPIWAQTAHAWPLRVLAAASLKGPLDQALADWRAAGGAASVVSYVATPALVRQIEQGAPADIFVSADVDWMDHLQARGGLRVATRRNLVGNALVLVAPVPARASSRGAESAGASGAKDGSSAGVPVPPLLGGDMGAGRAMPAVEALAALGGGRLAIGEVRSVPAGRYARAALESLGLWSAWSGRLAMTENVRAALALVARGEAPLGIVYASDALLEPGVRVLARINPACHPPIVYPAAVLAGAKHPLAGQALDYLSGPSALTRFTQAGLLPIAGHESPASVAVAVPAQAGCLR